MHLDMNDPQTTAYALGELDGSQKGTFDEHVLECESCRQAVAEIRELAATITKELATKELPAEMQPKLQSAQREAVEQRLAAVDRPRLVSNKLFLALAASLLVAVGTGVSIYWASSDRGPANASRARWQKDDVAYVSDSSASNSQYEAMSQTSTLDKTSGQGGRPGNIVGGPQPAAGGDHAAPTGVTTFPRANGGHNLYYTGDDNSPVAPMAEVHAPNLATTTSPPGTPPKPKNPFSFTETTTSPATTTPSSAAPGPSQTTASQSKPIDPDGQVLKSPAKKKSLLFDLDPKHSPQGRTSSRAPDPAASAATSKPPASEPDYTVRKPTYETRTDGPVPASLPERLKIPDHFPGANDKPVIIPPRTGKEAPNQGPTDSTPYNMPEGKKFAELNAPRGETKQVAADFSKPRDPRIIIQEEEVKAQQVGQESYAPVVDNAFLPALQNPLSTFSIDVDTASYANVRRMLGAGQRPPKDAVRIEEMVNYFTYDYAPPKDDRPFSAHVEMADCPWHGEHRLVRIGLKGKDLGAERRPACNLVFLLDVSGSMNAPNKLPLVKESMRLLISRLNEEDNVAIVVYAGASGLALPSTSCEQKQKILAAIDNLQAGGSTNGAAGIQLAYDTAAGQFIRGGVNRVILCTDGDFNVGITSQEALTKLIQEKAKGGVFLSVLGFGMGNLKDSTLEKLADLGNGNYAYIDSQEEARKVLVRQLNGTLVTIAKDVKIQVEFNPAVVSQYRLIGYENRMLKAEDFNNDKKDAGEIGAGHTVTALYEIVPVTKAGGTKSPEVDGLKYQKVAPVDAVVTDEVMTLKLRYKAPDGDTSKLIEFPVKDEAKKLGQTSGDFRFAAAVAAFGMLLRNSEHRGSATWDGVIELAGEPMSAADQKEDQADELKARLEFLDIVRRAKQVAGE